MSVPSSQLWTVNELAEWLRVSPMAVRAMIKRRQLPSEAFVRIGRRVRFRVDAIQSWVLKSRVA